MSLFSLHRRALGVDFGTASIKAIELELRSGKPYLVNYGEAELLSPERRSAMPVRSFHEDVRLRFHALLDRMKPQIDRACVSMPAFLGLISLIEFPEMTDKELEEAVRFEAKKYVPSPLEDVTLSWEKVGVQEVRGDAGRDHPAKIEVLLVAALNKDVRQYEEYARSVGYTLHLLELETFSIARAITGNDPGVFLIIDIGARATNLVLVENGFVKMSRNLDVGGIDITRTLSEGLNIALDRAETLKKSGKDFLNKPEAAIIFPGIEMLASEIMRMLDVWKSTHPGSRIDSLLLSGGTAKFTGFSEYLSKHIGIPALLADPWKSIVCPEELKESIEKMGTGYSVAVGLALHGIKEK